jgi:hypothetical protein
MWIDGFLRNRAAPAMGSRGVKPESPISYKRIVSQIVLPIHPAGRSDFYTRRQRSATHAPLGGALSKELLLKFLRRQSVLCFYLWPVYGSVFFFREGIGKFDIARFLVTGDSSGHKIDQFPLG